MDLSESVKKSTLLLIHIFLLLLLQSDRNTIPICFLFGFKIRWDSILPVDFLSICSFHLNLVSKDFYTAYCYVNIIMMSYKISIQDCN